MQMTLILASKSETRAKLLTSANVDFVCTKPNIAEENLKIHFLLNGTDVSKISGKLAETKAKKINLESPSAFVIGCDQTLIFKTKLLSKVKERSDVINRLYQLNNCEHHLYTSAVIYFENNPIWRVTKKAKLRMKNNSDAYITDYVKRNFDYIVKTTGCYMIEGEGVRLFKYIEGDYFSILGLPLIQILNFLDARGKIG